MQKKNLKPLLLSSLAALAMAGVGAGATFALFTDKAETQINVTAGVVHVKTEVEIVEAYELGDVAMTKDTETKYHNSIGGKVEWVDNELKLENWAPGDKVVLKVTNTNLSNVATKTRLVQKHSSTTEKDLFDALEVNYEATNKHQSITGSIFRWASIPAASGATGDLLSEITLTIEFPNVGTEITSRDEGDNNIYQGMNTSISFAQEAVQGNAEVQSLVDDLDAVMVPSVTVNRSLSEALTEVNTIADEESIKNEGLIWSVAADRFVYEGEASGAKLNYFKIYDAMPKAQSYSIYATDAWENTTSVEGLEVGFDAGSSSVVSIGVRTEKAITITVATKGGTLTVYAPNATVNHYGSADRVDVTSVAGNSYHEFGSVVVASLKKGHIALEEGSNVLALHLEKTVTGAETKFDSLKVSLAENVALPELSRDRVSLASNETLKVVEVASEQSGQTSSEFIYLSGNGTFEDSKVLVASEDDAAQANPVAEADASEAAKALANIKENDQVVETGKEAADVAEPFASGVVYSSVTKEIYTEEELNGDITSVFNAGGTATMLKDYTQNSIVMLGKAGSENIIDIDGRGHKLSVNNTRAVRITQPNCDIKFRNIQIENVKHSGGDLRCVSIDSNASGSKVLFDGCSLSADYYTVNATAASNLDITIKNGTVAAGWAAINSYSSNSKWTVINSVLKGLNDKGESDWNSFNTITFDGGCLYGGTTGVQGSNNDITITNSTIYASSESSNKQYWIGLQYGANGNTVTVDDQTRIINANGEDESATINLGYYYNYQKPNWTYYENTSWVRVGDLKYERIFDSETGEPKIKVTQIVELP